MRLIVCLILLSGWAITSVAQSDIQKENKYLNSAERLLSTDGKLTIGGYGEVHYNQELRKNMKHNGKLDVHRMVMLFGYNFNSRTQFITEIEFEHVKEVYIEQAFLQHKINHYLSFRAGLLLVPMGIINEFHEPITFNGVERPLIDKYIIPSTWREIGLGFTGNLLPLKSRYQVYLVNGFNGYDGISKLDGSSGLRGGRQKGAESYMSSPNFTGKIEFYGIRGLNLGISTYMGNTQSSLYDGIDKNDPVAMSKADSSVIGISMIGADARYSLKGFQLRGQYYHVWLQNTTAYNAFTSMNGQNNDLGSRMTGYYLEAGYQLFRHFEKLNTQLIPFVRYEKYNTHEKVEGQLVQNAKYDNTVITTGISWKLNQGAVLKSDLQFIKSGSSMKFSKSFNAGFGVMF